MQRILYILQYKSALHTYVSYHHPYVLLCIRTCTAYLLHHLPEPVQHFLRLLFPEHHIGRLQRQHNLGWSGIHNQIHCLERRDLKVHMGQFSTVQPANLSLWFGDEVLELDHRTREIGSSISWPFAEYVPPASSLKIDTSRVLRLDGPKQIVYGA